MDDRKRVEGRTVWLSVYGGYATFFVEGLDVRILDPFGFESEAFHIQSVSE